MPCGLLNLCEYDTHKLVKIKSVRLGSLKWMLNGIVLMFICIMLFWNKEYQAYDLVVSSVTSKVKGVAQTTIPGIGEVVWDVVDHSGPSQGKNSFFVVTNVISTKQQKQGRCPETPQGGRSCRSDKDCEKGYWDQHSHGVQTGVCVRFDVTRKTCEVSAWCPVESKTRPPRPALLASAENFTVLIKNNIRFPAFNYIRRNILPEMTDVYLKRCVFHRRSDPYCPIFRLGDIVTAANENFKDMALEGGVIGIQINWDCDLNRFFHRCLPQYSFRRLDEKESNRTLYPGLNFRFARYYTENGSEYRNLFKAFGIRFDVMVFGKAGKFSLIQLILYIGSTLSYYALTTVFLDWLIGTSCYSREAGHYSDRKFESVLDQQESLLCVSFVDEDKVRVVKRSKKKSLQDVKALSFHHKKEDAAVFRALIGGLQAPGSIAVATQNGISKATKAAEERVAEEGGGRRRSRRESGDEEEARSGADGREEEKQGEGGMLLEMAKAGGSGNSGGGAGSPSPSWCRCGSCAPGGRLEEQLCCRRGRGHCISSSPIFSPLVLSRSTLHTLMLYRSPLAELHQGDQLHQEAQLQQEAQLHREAYAQYISWRFGDTLPLDATPVVPSCCAAKIRAAFPGSD